MSKKILKLHQANEDGATDISTQFTPVTIDGGGSSSIEISQDIETDKLNTNKVPSTKAVYDFMSWIPKDIITNQEFNTGKTIDGKTIYGMYLFKPTDFKMNDKTLIYAAPNFTQYPMGDRQFLIFIPGTENGNQDELAVYYFQLPSDGGQLGKPVKFTTWWEFIGFVFYTKK